MVVAVSKIFLIHYENVSRATDNPDPPRSQKAPAENYGVPQEKATFE